MDPVTHLMYGATLARTGFNRKAAYATLAMTLAAEAPDIDMLWGLRGPVAELQHHRGITHTFLGLPLEAAAVLGVVYGIHRIRLHRARSAAARTTIHSGSADPSADEPIPQPLTRAPVRWGLLYTFILIALLSHLLLDWTNNYGLRPFFPFNPHWYALSIVFIVEPVMLALLALALLAPPLFGLVAGEVGARRTPYRGRGWALFAILAIGVLWAVRYVEHADALESATAAPYGPAGAPIPPDQVLRVFASPAPGNPFLWHTVAETPAFFQLGTADTRRSLLDTDPAHDLLYKPQVTPAVALAKESWLGRVYLDWSSWPLVSDLGPTPVPTRDGAPPPPLAPGQTLPTEVLFRDLRFLNETSMADGRQNPPLSGKVFVDLTRPLPERLVATYLNGEPQN